MKTAPLRKLLITTIALVVATSVMRGQSALDGFDPNANNEVRVVVAQPDGKILIGGFFTTVLGVNRNYIARLNPDGTLDAAFNPNANNAVFSIAVQADGKILAGGNFTSIGGQMRNKIARLDATTGLADSFSPTANGYVWTIVVQADGKILVGGEFSTIGGQPRSNIARLDAASGFADSFNPNAGSIELPDVYAIAVQADGKILAGGDFTTIGGQPRNRIARLDATTGMADSFNPSANHRVVSIRVQADGRILIGGDFTSIGGQGRNYIARLNATNGLADSFNPNANDAVFFDSIRVQADGKILVGGRFTNIGGQARNHIARLDAATGLADSFNPNANNEVSSIAVQADGKILAGGGFTTVAPNGGSTVTRNNIARMETDGRLDQTLNLNIVGPLTSFVAATAEQPDGRILIGGIFSTVLGVARNNIARLNTDGTLDLGFNPNANSEVDAIAVQADGKILVGGFFNGANSIGGQTRNYVARLDATTGSADSFDPNANNLVRAIAVQADGKIVVGGLFSGANSIGGATRNHIARLDPMTGLADSFDPNANGNVFSITLQPDGKILAGGSFGGANSIGGATRNRIARLDVITGLADAFDPNANGSVFSIALQNDGRILAGGSFNGTSSIGGQTRNYIARLDAATGAADSFNPNANDLVESIAVQANGKILAGGFFNGANSIGGATRNRIARLDPITGLADAFDPNANGIVFSIALQNDGKVLAGGTFTGANSIGGQPRDFFARLTNGDAALQNIVVTQNSITWIRGGSSVQLTRVLFEYSTDSANYTPLGYGIPISSGWTLTGLNLATGQNVFIRARGYYRSGNQNASESITESVRNVFITLPPGPSLVASRKVHNGVPYDIALPLTSDSGIECRSGGETNDYQVVFTFPSSVTFTNAVVTAGTGSISGSSGYGTTTVTVSLTGVTNAQRITVTLTGVSDGKTTGDLSVPMGVLVGDSNGNGRVNSGDVAQAKSQIGQAIDSTNFRSDVNANGAINAGDVSLIKSRIGSALP